MSVVLKNYVILKDRILARPFTDIERLLRCGSQEEIFTKRAVIASYINGYNWLFETTNAKRNYVCNKVKNILDKEQSHE